MQAAFEMSGVPASWPNRRGHWAKQAREKAGWRATTEMLANSQRHLQHWARPTAEDGKAQVTITLYRVRELDQDNAMASVKPILDGVVGTLIYDDRSRYCELKVIQEKVEHYGNQRTRVEVVA